jgi:hypothetical protein
VDSSGNVYVTDYWNSRVEKFDSSSTYITQWGSKSSDPATGVAVDCHFAYWTGTGTGTYPWWYSGTSNPATITMNVAITETANFS